MWSGCVHALHAISGVLAGISYTPRGQGHGTANPAKAPIIAVQRPDMTIRTGTGAATSLSTASGDDQWSCG